MVFRAAAGVFVPFSNAEFVVACFEAVASLLVGAEFVVARSVEGSVVSFSGAEFVIARAEAEVVGSSSSN